MDKKRMTPMNTSLLLTLAMVLAVSSSLAQVVVPERDGAADMKRSVFGIGFAGGPASGLGLSFRYHLPSIVSYQVIGGIVKVDDRMSYSIGAEVQVDLSRTGVVRVFAAGGASYFYSGRASHNDMEGPGRLGFGMGGELYASSGIHTTLELLFTYFDDGTVLPLPQLAFHYYFR
jgi:hypothetical protein